MKQQVLKALANPAYIFYVPYSLAVINFLVQFLIFVIIFLVRFIVTGIDTNPLYFLISVIIVHCLLIRLSKKDQQFGQILRAKLQLFTKKIPRKLAA
jgi:type IV secretory pathway VirB3-like protein